METQTLVRTKWNLDIAHSSIEFKVRHLLVSTFRGHFSKFDIDVETNGDNFETANIKFTADVNSIQSGNEQRNGHLKSDDFFNEEKFPKIKFESTGIKKADDENYKLTGDLTIRDITKSVQLNAEFGGAVQDPWGNERVGFHVTGKINRKEFGLKWNMLTEAGGAVAGDEVKIECAVEFTKQK
jgi:polyisoprenoid-binding protein YceI